MGRTIDLGRRVELVSMDPHCADISIGLYRQAGAYRVHTYSAKPGASERIEFVNRALGILAGMEPAEGTVRHCCGEPHGVATRRAFLESCKQPSTAALAARPLSAADKKSGKAIVIESLAGGQYRVTAEGDAARADSIAAGFRKLAEVETADGGMFRFPCGHAHDPLIGLLLPRALNVRLTMREEEMAASRGVLAAPSARK